MPTPQNIRNMTKTVYAALRRDPRWQKKRLEVMERDEFKCRHCGSADGTLNVDHAYYVKGRMPWQYPMFSLTTLCEDCHEQKHGPLQPGEEFGFEQWEEAVDFCLQGGRGCVGTFWYLAAEMAKAYQRGVSSEHLEHITKLADPAHDIMRTAP